MSTKPANKSLDWLVGSDSQPGLDPLLAAMQQRGIPLTRDNYLKIAYPEGVPNPLDPEIEAELPAMIRDR